MKSPRRDPQLEVRVQSESSSSSRPGLLSLDCSTREPWKVCEEKSDTVGAMLRTWPLCGSFCQ